MNRKLTQAEFDKIELLFNQATTAHTKADAKPYMDRLEFAVNQLPYEIAGNVRIMASELASATKSATGQARQKDHWLSVATQLLYKLHSFGIGEENQHE